MVFDSEIIGEVQKGYGGSKIDTLLKLLDKPHERTIEREPSVPISKDAVDDQCDDIDVHVEDHYESDYRDAHLEDETDIGIEIGKEQNKNEAVNQYTRKRKRDSIGFDGPSFAILTPTPPTTQMSIDEGLSMEVEGNVEEELGRGKRNKKLSWQLKSPFEQKRKRGTSMAHNENTPKYTGWIKSKYTRTCIFHYAKDDENLLKKFIGWLGKEKRKGRKKVGQTDIYAEDNGVRKNPYKLYHQKISRKIFFLELADSSYVLDDKV
nr:uncharacterized protein LOC104110038 [Nicotiana tomentosiformis]